MIKVPMFQAADLLAISRRALGVVFIGSAITLLASSSAFAERNGGQGHGNPHANQGQRAGPGNHGQRAWHNDRQGYRYQNEYRHPYRYSQPVYVPPPVYYEPRQSPGISLFFPLDLRR